MSSVQLVSSYRSFGGLQQIFSHESSILKCMMKFSIYLPPNHGKNKLPIIYWLSGLTCTEQNFIQKAGAQKYASQYQMIIVCPDTSPRGCNIPGEDDEYDFGSGAGFYVDATEEPWSKHYKMYSYVTKELPSLISSNFPIDSTRQSIMGHSMGGHGALICYLKNPGMYKSVSAFAPICNPTCGAWGRKAFSGYLGGASPDSKETPDSWKEYDATLLVKKASSQNFHPNIFIDQGSEDEFLKSGQLLPDNFVKACREAEVPVIVNMRDGYDHSYFYIATFIEEHFKHHAKYLEC